MTLNVKTAGILQILLGAGNIIGVPILFKIMQNSSPGLLLVGSYVLVTLIAFVSLYIVTPFALIGGIGLVFHKRWGRVIIILVSFVEVICFPFGTAISLYSLFTLLSDKSQAAFHHQPT